jgi:hypothetical protein
VAELGPHLLGRKPSPPDERDYKMATVLQKIPQPDDTLLDKTVAEVRAEGFFFSSWQGILAFWRFIRPAKKKPAKDVVWSDPIQLDQEDTGHCVGFSWAGWGNTDPVEDNYQDPDGHAIYYECKAIDLDPAGEDGTYVRSGAKAMRIRGRLDGGYYFAGSVHDVRQWLQLHGPVVFGTDWYDAMFDPDPDGTVHIGGEIAGGHAYVCVGDLISEDAALCRNSWGAAWGKGGYFKIKWGDFAKLLNADGEACAGLELPLP